jgi:hypothetical protein
VYCSHSSPFQERPSLAATFRGAWKSIESAHAAYLNRLFPCSSWQKVGVVQFVSMWKSLDDDSLSPEELKLACRARFQALK